MTAGQAGESAGGRGFESRRSRQNPDVRVQIFPLSMGH